MGIRDNIIQLREHYGITQSDLAKIAGVSRGAVSQWEGGFSEPRMGAIQKIADHFRIAKSNIIEDDGMKSIIYPDMYDHRKADVHPVSIKVVPTVMVPVVGHVHAGQWEDEEVADRVVPVADVIVANHPEAKGLIVDGHCMDRVIPEGSCVLYDPEMTEPANGSVVIVETEDYSALMRRWHSTGKTLLLEPDSFDDTIDDIVLRWEDGPIKVIGTVFHCQSAREID